MVADPIFSINEKIRFWIKDVTDLEFEHKLILNDNLNIFGFSGLTESGKSSHAQALASQHNGYRLKLSFFDVATGLYTKPRLRDEHVVLLFLDFIRNHYFANVFTVESLHGIQLSAVFKIFFGSYFKIVYMECSKKVRVSRAEDQHNLLKPEAIKLIESKDFKKNIQNTEMNRDYADVIIDIASGVSIQDAINVINKYIS